MLKHRLWLQLGGDESYSQQCSTRLCLIVTILCDQTDLIINDKFDADADDTLPSLVT